MKQVLWSRLQQEWQIWQVGALPGLAVIGLVMLLRGLGTLQFLELTVFDYFLRSRPAEPMDERVLIVGINEDDIRQLQRYPIPDQALVDLLQKIQSHRPSVIGFDIVRDYVSEKSQLSQAFQKSSNWIAIERIQMFEGDEEKTAAPAGVTPEQIGFVNAMLDQDKSLRRSLLGASDLNDEYRFSLTARLAMKYLSDRGYELENVSSDPAAFRFGQTELRRFGANTGGYVNADDGGNQVLINFRSGETPFRTVSLTDIKTGKFKPEWIRDRVVLVGITSVIYKDVVNSGAIVKPADVSVFGVEIQAHAVSQILSAVLDGRSLLRSLDDGWEYLWIFAWGMLGISLGRINQSPLRILLGLGGTSILLVGVCFGSLLMGWWLPVVPAFMALFLNGAGLTAALFYRYGQDLQMQIQQRQSVINQTFDAIHSGPLQTLSQLLRTTKEQNLSSNELQDKLQQLDEELRAVWESVCRAALTQDPHLRLSNAATLDLNASLSEALSEVFYATLQRDLPYFKTLKLKIPDVEMLDERFLMLEQKQMICRFVEEAMCNVGKHAIDATCLQLVCRQEQGQNVIRVVDDGRAQQSAASQPRKGGLQTLKRGGTWQAEELARLLHGKFQRSPNLPTGTICELRWSAKRR
jgi:CHASE2 domain-containing sensor protein/two-component sensor histidine kinase